VKWLGIAWMVCAALAVPVASAVAAPPSLPMSEARDQAESEAVSFTVRHNLTESHVGRCKRLSARSVACAAIAKGETSAASVICHLQLTVRLVRHRFYNTTEAAITAHRCAKTPKERLTYKAAIQAIQSAADSFAGQATAIGLIYRLDELTYEATAKWDRAAVRPNEFRTTESCSVELKATLSEGKVSVATEGFACF
jgi:hypothetical protein